MSSDFLSFHIQIVEKFNHALMELSDLNLGGTILYLSLDDVDIPILYGHKLSLSNELGVLCFKFFIDLSEDSSVLLLFHVIFSLLHSLQFSVKSLLFFLALFLELGLLFSKPSFLLNHGRDSHDLVLLDG